MKKNIKSKNRNMKYVNNHKTKLHHKTGNIYHMMSKDILLAYASMSPIYEELNKDFQTIDVVDLLFYERWLNG